MTSGGGCAFVPLVAGLYWKRATNTGAGLSIALGFGCWVAMEFIAPDAALPPQFAGLIAGTLGMVAGSVLAAKGRG
jgi:SSS family solute:Na+ symporter